MACNCNNSTPCNNCSSNLPCNCPPDYSVLPQPVPCKCCPSGYSYQGPTANYPSGYCQTIVAPYLQTPTIPCNTCIDSVPISCVYNDGTVNCLGSKSGDPLSTVLANMCLTNPVALLEMMRVVAADSTYGLKAAWCQISNFCSGIPGSKNPYIGPITFTIP